MIVFVRMNGETPLYQVAGSARGALGAEKALREAHRIHGGACFFCQKRLAPDEVTVDHAEAQAGGGRQHLQNLLIACRPCNQKKGQTPIETFDRQAGTEWLTAVLKQVEDRLNRL